MVICLGFYINSGSMKYLQSKQLNVGILDNLEQHEQFPITQQENDEIVSESDSDHNIENDERSSFIDHQIVTTTNSIIDVVAFWKNMSRYEFGLLSSSIIINNLTWMIETIFIFYFVLFITYRYDKNIIYCTMMLVLIISTFGIIMLLTPIFIKIIIPKYIWLMILSSFILGSAGIFGGFLALDEETHIIWYWILCALGGFLLGLISILSEMCILELQPKEHIGKVTGWKDSMKMAFRGLGVGIVGFFWIDPYYEAIWFGIAAGAILCCILSFIIWTMIGFSKKGAKHVQL